LSGDCHHKYAIVDHSELGSDPLVITGSHNWSSTAESVNDENTVIVHNARVANLYHQEFRGIVNAINGTGDAVLEGQGRSLALLPNPARENVWLVGLEASDRLEVRDAAGRLAAIHVHRQAGAAQLEVGALAQGVYHVVVTTEAGVPFTLRLAVQ
jgi:phosphatidylserine/phosphatidylglycerophosphate/cardiolipin synthase-like enzyme